MRKYTIVDNLISITIGCVIGFLLVMIINERPVTSEVNPEIRIIKVTEYKPNMIMKSESCVPTPTPIPVVKKVEPKKYERVLNSYDGVAYGPSGKETYYNLPMGGVVKIMRKKGYTEEEYPYWVREDGVKCLGEYIMVAANLDRYKRGEIIETTLGEAIVCDTGSAMKENPDIIDVAVDW